MNPHGEQIRFTLPAIAVRYGRQVDWIRRRFRKYQELASLIETAGPVRFVTAENLLKVEQILGLTATA